jgi:DNA-binding SARP family transcriptional activator
MVALRLQMLDGFRLEASSAPVDIPAGMQRFLALLALKGPMHRCVAAGTLWPEVPEHRALARLRTSIWRINRVHPGLIVPQGLGLATAQDLAVDSREQELFVCRLLRDRVEDARWIADGLTQLWPEHLLPGWYDDWVVLERERLGQLRLHALERASAVMRRNRHLDAAFQLALEAVHSEPLRESANAALMEVYLAEGNLSDAVHQYLTFRALLGRELGVEPSPALDRLLPGGWLPPSGLSTGPTAAPSRRPVGTPGAPPRHWG